MWWEQAFGFRLRVRIGKHRAQMQLETGTALLTEQVEGSQCSVMVPVADLDALWERAHWSSPTALARFEIFPRR